MNCDKAMAACRKIEVPYWATHFAKIRNENTDEVNWAYLDQQQEIPS